eukprot:623528-Amorphochlora_amoeboformis.AAC.1
MAVEVTARPDCRAVVTRSRDSGVVESRILGSRGRKTICRLPWNRRQALGSKGWSRPRVHCRPTACARAWWRVAQSS